MSLPTPKQSVRAIAPYIGGKASAEGFERVIKLSANENALGCSALARLAYCEAGSDLSLYPDGQALALRAALAVKFNLAPQRILFGAGSDEIFSMVCQAYLNPGDNIVQPRYGFAAWSIAARAAGGLVKSAPEAAFSVDVDAVLANVDRRTRIVFIANPANPTGSCLPFTEIARLHAGLPSHVLLLLDGAYAEYAAGVAGFADGLDLAREAQNVIVTRTFSKLYGLAALRIGWAYAPEPVIETLNRIRLPYNASRPAQAAAVAALGDDVFVARSIAHAEAGRVSLAYLLGQLGLEPIASATNFVTARFARGSRVNAIAAEHALAGHGILVRGLGDYGLGDCLRITLGTVTETARLVDELKRILL